MRVAYLSPFPPQRSGIADYSWELLPYLARLIDITVFGAEAGQPLAAEVEWRPLQKFEAAYREFDLVLYQMGNSEYHDNIAALAMRYPGVIVLHDDILHHSVLQRTVGAGKRFAYWREMGFELGATGVRRAAALEHGVSPPLFDASLNGRLLQTSLGAIVHSNFVKTAIRRRGYRGPIAIVPAQITPFTGEADQTLLPLSPGATLFAAFGLMTREKQIQRVLGALAALRAQGEDVHLLLVGEALEDVDLDGWVQVLGLQSAVHQQGFVPDLGDFVQWIHRADIVINLRNPTVGETSATALRAMAAGRPLIVNDHGWYREIPAAAALHVSPADDEALLQAMARLAESPSLRQAMGEAGRRYAIDVCHPEVVAMQYRQALETIQQAIRVYG